MEQGCSGGMDSSSQNFSARRVGKCRPLEAAAVIGEHLANEFLSVGLLPCAEALRDVVIRKMAGEIDFERHGAEFFEELRDDFGRVENRRPAEAEVRKEHVVHRRHRSAGGEGGERAGDDNFYFDIFHGESLQILHPFFFHQKRDDGRAGRDDRMAEGFSEGVPVAGGAHALIRHPANRYQNRVGRVRLSIGCRKTKVNHRGHGGAEIELCSRASVISMSSVVLTAFIHSTLVTVPAGPVKISTPSDFIRFTNALTIDFA